MGCMVGCDLDYVADALAIEDTSTDIVTEEEGGKGGDGCLVDLDCEDYDPSTVDTCIDAVCVHPGIDCTTDEECEDGIPYTQDFCGEDGKCSEYWLECWWSQDCNDGVACTKDVCVAGECDNSPKEDACDDADPCTLDFCDPEKGCDYTDVCDDSL